MASHRMTILVPALVFGFISVSMARSEAVFSIEPVPGSLWAGGHTVKVEVFLTSSTDVYVKSVAADLPCNLPGQTGSSGAIGSGTTGSIVVQNQSDPASGSIPWVFAPQGTCTAGAKSGQFCMTAGDCPGGSCDTSLRNGGLKPLAVSACRFSGQPGVGEPAYLLPANQKRYVGTALYQVSDCTFGDFGISFELLSEPCVNTDLSRVVDENNNCVTLTPEAPAVEANSPSLYADLDIPFGIISVNDLLCLLQGYIAYSRCPMGDIYPCGGDGFIEVGDVVAMLAAYGGNYSCPEPCP